MGGGGGGSIKNSNQGGSKWGGGGGGGGEASRTATRGEANDVQSNTSSTGALSVCQECVLSVNADWLIAACHSNLDDINCTLTQDMNPNQVLLSCMNLVEFVFSVKCINTHAHGLSI